MILNKKKVAPRPKTEKEITREIFKDLLVFIAQYAGILAGASIVMWMFGADIDTDFGAYLLCMFLIYKQWIKPKLFGIQF